MPVTRALVKTQTHHHAVLIHYSYTVTRMKSWLPLVSFNISFFQYQSYVSMNTVIALGGRHQAHPSNP